MTDQQGREIELKLELKPDDAARIGRLKSLPRARVGLPRAEQIITVYFDTEDRALRRAGLSLRLRHAGTRRLQTVKTELGQDLAAGRIEDEVPLNGAGPDIASIADPGLRERVMAAADRDALKPVFETNVLRTTRLIKTQDGDVVELVVDQGELRTDGETWPICELELELKGGSPTALFSVARVLNDAAPLRIVRLSKADRGYALLGDPIGAAQKAKAVALPRKPSLSLIFQRTLGSCVAQLMANEPALVEDRDVEAMHQFRVGLRRTRAALDTFAPLLKPDEVDRLEHEVRALAQMCGAARDYDVFVTTLMPAAKDSLSEIKEARAALAQAAAIARNDAWAKASEMLVSGRYTDLVLDLAHLAAAPPPTLAGDKKKKRVESARSFAAKVLDGQLKKAEKLAAGLGALVDEDRHRLRKRLKRLRYTGDFFAGLFPPEETRAYLKRLGALQDCFGTLNDLATATRLVEALQAFGAPGQAGLVTEAGARVVDKHRRVADTAMADAERLWRKLARREPFWHMA